MVHTVWRIGTDTPDYGADDRSGKGAEKSGGRWNREGTPVLYTSLSRALACLETLVHLSGSAPLPLNRYLVEITIPQTAWKARRTFDRGDPANVGWDAEPAGLISIDWGTAWLDSKASLVAVVPSIIVPEEENILLNPRHPDAGKLRFAKKRKWTYDLRLG
jgi:RES domain-containing protein